MQYLALSHCWGKAKIPALTMLNLHTMMAKIDLERLPKTLQDAILVTRRLQYRYLWIDSLCVLQDSMEDWEKEAATMSDVYNNAVLIIMASWGKDGSTGCFVERPFLSKSPCRIFEDARKALYISPESVNEPKYTTPLPLEKRAWAVQDRALPTKTLSFRDLEMQRTCLESRGSEAWPLTGAVLSDKELTSSENQSCRDLLSMKPGLRGADIGYMCGFYKHWRPLIALYTACKLSFPDDILVTISGLVKRIEKQTGLTNIFRMWKDFLLMDLMWEGTPGWNEK